MSKRALVMSGGSARGAFEAGAAEYLVCEKPTADPTVRGLDFDIIAGVSVGALNAAMLAQGHGHQGLKDQMQKLHDLWYGIESYQDFYRKYLPEKIGFAALLCRNSLYDPKGTREKIKNRVDPAKLQRSGKEFRIGAVSLESGLYQSITQGDSDIHHWIMASATTPISFPPVEIGRENVVDGGARNITPLKDVFAALKDPDGSCGSGPHEIWVLLSSPLAVQRIPGTHWNAHNVAFRSLDILTNEIYREDLLYALDVNKSVTGYLRAKETLEQKGWPAADIEALLAGFPFKPDKYCAVTIWTVAPTETYGDWFKMEINKATIRRAYEDGKDAAATKVLDEAALTALLRR